MVPGGGFLSVFLVEVSAVMGSGGTEEGKGLGRPKLASNLIVARLCLVSLGHARRGAPAGGV